MASDCGTGKGWGFDWILGKSFLSEESGEEIAGFIFA
jgi:hypothetical protein